MKKILVSIIISFLVGFGIAIALPAIKNLKLDYSLILAVGLPIFAWIILVVLYLWKLTKTFLLNGDSNVENPYKAETMGLPRGTIRGILTLTLLFIAILLQLYAIRHDALEKINVMMGAFELMLAFYFGSKVMHHLSATDKYKTQAVAEANKTNTQPVSDFDDPEAKG